MLQVGVDLHKRVTQVAVLGTDGEIQQHRMENHLPEVRAFFNGLEAPARIAIEATGTWWWLVDVIQAAGHEAILSHPKQTRAIAAARLKNDRVDAERLASLLRADLLPEVWIPPIEVREARELYRHRVSLVWLRTRVKNRLTAMLDRRNLQPTTTKRWSSKRGQQELQALELSRSAAAIRKDTLELLATLDRQIRKLDKEIQEQWGSDSRVQRLDEHARYWDLHGRGISHRDRRHPPIRFG